MKYQRLRSFLLVSFSSFDSPNMAAARSSINLWAGEILLPEFHNVIFFKSTASLFFGVGF